MSHPHKGSSGLEELLKTGQATRERLRLSAFLTPGSNCLLSGERLQTGHQRLNPCDRLRGVSTGNVLLVVVRTRIVESIRAVVFRACERWYKLRKLSDSRLQVARSSCRKTVELMRVLLLECDIGGHRG